MQIPNGNLCHTGFEVFIAWAQVDVRLLRWIVVFVTLRPIVANGVRKDLAVSIEATFGDRLFHRFGGFEFRSGVLIPETERTVRANGRQCTMNWMKSYIVHRIDVLDAVGGCYAMTFECEIIFGVHRANLLTTNEIATVRNTFSMIFLSSYCIFLIFTYVLYSDATFNATESISARCFLFVPENGNSPVLIF